MMAQGGAADSAYEMSDGGASSFLGYNGKPMTSYNLNTIYRAFYPNHEVPPTSYTDGVMPDKCVVCEDVLGKDVTFVKWRPGVQLTTGQVFCHNPWRCKCIVKKLEAARANSDPRFDAQMLQPLPCHPRDAPKA